MNERNNSAVPTPVQLHGGPAEFDLRTVARTAITEAVAAGKVFWGRQDVVDSALQTGALKCKVRYVPDFAFRQLLYDAPDAVPKEGCRLCPAVVRAEAEVPLEDVRAQLAGLGWWSRFDSHFALQVNNFPYFDGQLVAITREHRSTLTPPDYRVILEFLAATRFRTAALQVGGSGATIPEHAHITLADESLPIFDLPRPPIGDDRDADVALAEGYPGGLLVIAGGGIPDRVAVLAGLLEDLQRRRIAFNLFADDAAVVYLVPRLAEYSPAIARKIGSVEVAGVFLGNALGATTRDVNRLRGLIRARCEAMTPEQFLTALRQTVCPAAFGATLVERAHERRGRGPR